jgi:hypothetical protein
MSVTEQLRDALKSETLIQLHLGGGSHEGFVVGLGPDLVLLQTIHEWQDWGALVVPIAEIERCEVSEFHDDQVKILALNSVKRTKRYVWVRLGSMAELFKSLLPKGRFVVQTFGDEAEVGRIEAVNADSLDLKPVDPGGNWVEDTFECDFADITMVQFDDSYSRVLQRYAERVPIMN